MTPTVRQIEHPKSGVSKDARMNRGPLGDASVYKLITEQSHLYHYITYSKTKIKALLISKTFNSVQEFLKDDILIIKDSLNSLVI